VLSGGKLLAVLMPQRHQLVAKAVPLALLLEALGNFQQELEHGWRVAHQVLYQIVNLPLQLVGQVLRCSHNGRRC